MPKWRWHGRHLWDAGLVAGYGKGAWSVWLPRTLCCFVNAVFQSRTGRRMWDGRMVAGYGTAPPVAASGAAETAPSMGRASGRRLWEGRNTGGSSKVVLRAGSRLKGDQLWGPGSRRSPLRPLQVTVYGANVPADRSKGLTGRSAAVFRGVQPLLGSAADVVASVE